MCWTNTPSHSLPRRGRVRVGESIEIMTTIAYAHYLRAISYYEQSVYLRERSGDENAVAASFNNLALAYQSKGEYEKALEAVRGQTQIPANSQLEIALTNAFLGRMDDAKSWIARFGRERPENFDIQAYTRFIADVFPQHPLNEVRVALLRQAGLQIED